MSDAGDYYEVWICEPHEPGRLEGTPDTDNCPYCEVDRLREENEVLERVLTRQRESFERTRPLCPDHRDKQTGRDCFACEIARLRGMVREYLAEYDNPVPDLGLRRRLRDRLIEEVRGE